MAEKENKINKRSDANENAMRNEGERRDGILGVGFYARTTARYPGMKEETSIPE
jgi:hypothetical protein